ncbi:hypothetical protein Glove_12g47 [Diversispora epigaea]|uniref:Uncharacterized protein n=1 Tax=Diversispora epigaea TaxID=1348612 RepID=A0A397JQP4_9GLOM|nr:hypothetical protein Glove_12g47 [Diversispora epigaea]
MISPCPRCEKNNFKKTRDRDMHINRKYPCKPRVNQRRANINKTSTKDNSKEPCENLINEEFERLSVHPDNRSDIRKMFESQRKSFQELLEKEFDKQGQFKFALCSLTKFLLNDKPENEKKNSTRTDWLRNKQIIVYNRSEIDDHLSNAFEQILYQVEERGGKSNA